MSEPNVQEDLAYVRAMAEEGRNVPLVGGTNFMLWGGLIGTTALVGWCQDAGIFKIPFNTAWLWTGAIALGWAASMVMGRRTHNMPGASTFGNKTAAAAWMSCGIFITVFWLSILIAELTRSAESYPVGYLGGAMFPIAFGLYGLAFMVTSVASRQDWMRWVAIASWGISSLLIFSLNSSAYLLVAGLATYAVVFVPGFILYRNQPSTIV